MNALPFILLWLALIIISIPRSEPSPVSFEPINNSLKLEAIANYCLRYQKQPYINNCIKDRTKRNNIENGFD